MIYFENNQERVEFTDNVKSLIEGAINATIGFEEIDFDFEVNVYIVDNQEIRKINKEFRGIDRETDVLSFPMIDFNTREKYKVFESDKNPENNCVVLGDMVLSLEKAMEQANEYGHSFEREVAFLTVHSMLHLLGYDHEDEDERRVMRDKEEKVLTLIGLIR